MRRSNYKKIQKRQKKDRRHKLHERKQLERRAKADDIQRRQNAFPKYTIKNIDEAPPRLIEAVHEAMQAIPLAPELTDEKLNDLKVAKDRGFSQTDFGLFTWASWLGELIYRELQSRLQPALLRRCDVQCVPTGDRAAPILLEVRHLESVKGFVACSPLRPTIDLPSGSYTVAFNLRDDDHFIRRLEERTVAVPAAYACKGQVFLSLYRWQFFDPIVLPNGQYAARLWNWCDPQIALAEVWRDLLGEQARVTGSMVRGAQFFDSDSGRAYYLVGYCPIDESEFRNGYAILKTLLTPGMDNTPECQIVERGMDTRQRAEMKRRAAQQTMRELTISEDFSLIRQYHRSVPQVRFISQVVFGPLAPEHTVKENDGRASGASGD